MMVMKNLSEVGLMFASFNNNNLLRNFALPKKHIFM
jgi:hypothetical protein